jgi:hypothetical protein
VLDETAYPIAAVALPSSQPSIATVTSSTACVRRYSSARSASVSVSARPPVPKPLQLGLKRPRRPRLGHEPAHLLLAEPRPATRDPRPIRPQRLTIDFFACNLNT